MVKSDINLLPTKKKIPASLLLGIPAGILLLVGILALGIMAPSFLLNVQQTQLDALEKELSTYSAVETNYLQKLKEFATLQSQEKNYTDFVASDKLALDLLTRINAVKPSTVTILSENFDIEKVTVAGFATTDIEIARFEIELRKLALFPEILLDSITGPVDQRNFSFILMHKVETSQTSSAASSQEGSTSK